MHKYWTAYHNAGSFQQNKDQWYLRDCRQFHMGGRDGAVGLREERLHFREHTEAKAMSVGAGEKKQGG